MIKRLPKALVQRIAAGEVVERPASVVKELVENSLDAGARRVDVEIEKGGKRRIRISDDGRGMEQDQLPLAFASHATSKLSDLDDLKAIASYGFRGEALSSIGHVSHARISSRAEGAAEGFEISCDGGTLSAAAPCAVPFGTVIEIENLFFNTPARFKFLKNDAAEGSRCLEQVTRFAIAEEGIAFSLKSDGRDLLAVPATARRRDRIRGAFGGGMADALLFAKRSFGSVHVEAWLGPPEIAKGRVTHQHLFLNGRTIRDGTVRAAVSKAFREFLAPSLQPVWFVLLTADPADVDVNVHPTKQEVRFSDASAVFRAVHHTVLDALRGADLAPRPFGQASTGIRSNRTAGFAQRVFEAAPSLEQANAPSLPMPQVPRHPSESSQAPIPSGPSVPSVPSVPMRTGRGLLRVFETYIVYESGDDVVLVDQHALHERVLFEKLRDEVRSGAVKMQRLVVPDVVEVGRPAVLRAEGLGDAFASLGLEVSAFGETSLAVHGMPALLKRASTIELVRGVLAQEEDGASAGDESDAHDAIDERLHSMACRGAVKAGDTLTDGEIIALLDEAARLPEAKACPHGRPTTVRMGRGDLERWFKRSGF